MFAGGTVSASGMTFRDVIVRSGTVTLGSDMDMAGDLQVVSGTLDSSGGSFDLTVGGRLIVGGTLRTNASLVTVNGDVTVNGAYVAGSSTLVLAGSTLQVLGGTCVADAGWSDDRRPGRGLPRDNVTLTGTLTLANGQFIVGPHAIGLSQPITGTATNLSADATSTVVVTGTGTGIALPDSVTTLGGLTVNNPNGVAISAPLTVAKHADVHPGQPGGGAV